MDANDGFGCRNFSAGEIVAVPANTLHSAENPDCTPVRAMQALTGAVRFLDLHMLVTLLHMLAGSCRDISSFTVSVRLRCITQSMAWHGMA